MELIPRTDDLLKWVKKFITVDDIYPVPGDASARRYFRVISTNNSLIAVSSPIHTENNVAFVEIAKELANAGLNVPQVYQIDYENGFMLLSDLGDCQLLKVLSESNVDDHYTLALEELLKIQRCQMLANFKPPHFDRVLLLEELNKFHEWYLTRHLSIKLTQSEISLLQKTYDLIIDKAVSQPYVFVHRDYHSRNLMLLNDRGLGILDFQDGVMGPITYDLVSLLRDCYIKWPINQVYQWVQSFWEQLPRQQLAKISKAQFSENFDWMGLQRHLKVLGIFARLFRRDQKSAYLSDIPRTLNYILFVCDQYPELNHFKYFLTTRVFPHESNDIGSWTRCSTASING